MMTSSAIGNSAFMLSVKHAYNSGQDSQSERKLRYLGDDTRGCFPAYGSVASH